MHGKTVKLQGGKRIKEYEFDDQKREKLPFLRGLKEEKRGSNNEEEEEEKVISSKAK